ncbi:MAG: transglutaminase domain-containing protein [Saprospiraceae bacterium]|nr:hypothetical protein [Lewinellaceae bacterium]
MLQLFHVVCVLLPLTLVAQEDVPAAVNKEDFPAIDARATGMALKDQNIIVLTDSLLAPYTTDREKARAIYAWLGAHIAYDCGGENRLAEEPETAVHPLYYTQQQVENILKTRRTRCDGYALLFKLMCNLGGIYCSRLEGYARFTAEKVDPATVHPNHAWNAALLDGNWCEIDVTAGAGKCAGSRFHRQLDDAHFCMSAKLLEQKYILIEDERQSQYQGRVILKF